MTSRDFGVKEISNEEATEISRVPLQTAHEEQDDAATDSSDDNDHDNANNEEKNISLFLRKVEEHKIGKEGEISGKILN